MKQIIRLLQQQKKSTVTLEELEGCMQGEQLSYEEFASSVLDLEEQGKLEMVSSKGRNMKTPSLAYRYRIRKNIFTQSFHQQLQQYRLQLHPLINIDPYFSLDSSIWNENAPYIEKINLHLRNKALPQEAAPAPERSFELVGDEKWITEKNGKECLDRIGLWDKMKIIPVADPLMFAVNPNALHDNGVSSPIYFHLIVENKTPYQALLTTLPSTVFTTLVYGCGKKIIKSLENFEYQLPIANGNHTFFYFGDLDSEGIMIWHLLNKTRQVQLALPFYRECLTRNYVHGKEYQRKSEDALNNFLSNFHPSEQHHLLQMLDDGGYIPQEILNTKELQEVWRTSTWS